MNYKPLAALVLATALTGCNNPCQIPSTEAAPVSFDQQSQSKSQNWDYKIKSVKYPGRTLTTDYVKSEAVDTWTVVNITIKNKSKQRQKANDGFVGVSSALLIDVKGKGYEAASESYSHSPDLDTEKPFAPGETRTMSVLFDTPKGTKPSQIVFDPHKISGATVQVKIK